MQAIILAAGMGKRLGNLTLDNTKCMVKVNGISLIDRLLTQLSDFRLNRIILVIGYKGNELRDYINRIHKDLNISYIYNDIYDKTNNIYSLSLAKKYLQEDDTILIESDLIFDNNLFSMIINHPDPNLALVAKYESWMDGTMVKIDEDNNIVNFIPKKDFNFSDINSYYKTVNIYRFSKEFSQSYYIPFLEAYAVALGNNEYYEQVLRVITLLDKCNLKALPINGEKWYEIDDVEDLDIAETIFADAGRKLELIQKRYGGYWRFPDLLDFCYLVNPYFPPLRMKEEMRAGFDVLLSEYPSGLNINSLLAGKYFGMKKEYICVGNGAAELIKSLMSMMTGNIGVVFPTFEEYPNRCCNQQIVIFVPDNADFSYSAKDVMTFFQDKNITSLLLINPDNPSGNFIPYIELFILIRWAENKGITLIIDESFVDFSEEGEINSLLHDDILEEFHHLIVLKSISKSYGVPGVRLGILATANSEIMNFIREDVAIWNINSFGEFYMQIFGKYRVDYKQACVKFVHERSRFYSELQTIPFLRVIPSQANYFLCEVIVNYTSHELTKLLLSEYNILIKDCGKKLAFNQHNYVRLAVRNKFDNDRLIFALKQL